VADGFERFLQVLNDYKSLSLWAAAGTVAFPFLAQFVGVEPPYPDGVAPITAVLQLVSMALSFHFVSQRSRLFVNKIVVIAAGLAAALIVIYFIIFSLLAVVIGPDQTLVRGFVCTPEALEQFGSECPFLSQQSISRAAYSEEELWTFGSLIAARLLLFFVWVTFFTSVAVFFASFITYQRQRR